ncbi:NFX1-type zinc finger-containing protein 1-like isoform X2 [Ascaphus truei]|uniref:NFX1-type zinc finger-containing protein 1-like isoform X2 n=1 Tax=Ascaphus truei TaxID=8439 RepID=UPI003F5A10FA
MAGQDHQGDDLLDLNSLLGSQGDSASSSSVLNGNQDIGESSENKSTTEQTPDVLQASSELHHSRTQPNHPDHSYSSEKENHSSEDTGQPEEHRKYNPARAIRDKNSHAELSSNWRNTGKEQFSGCKPKDYSFETRKKSVPNLVLEESNNYSFVESSVINKERQLWKERELNSVEMTSMAKLEPSEIVMKLAAPGSGLKKLLNESSIDLQLLESLLAVLNKAIGCTTNRQNLIHLLNEVHGSLFLMQVLPSCILQYITTHQNTFPLIDHTLVLLSELVSIFPCSSFTEVTIVKTLLEKAVDEAQTNGKTFPEETQQKLVTLNDALQHSQKEKQEGRLRSDNNIYMIGNKGNIEDEDFRSLSIFPTYNDIYTDQKPHMRLNIISRSYPDAKSYLDTHFRLLREDFIRPLRDGISQLLTLESKNLAESKFDDIRIYFDTKILYPLCTRAGIVHQVKFSMSNLKQVTWEISRRLLYGALVCLSKDNFQNMLFATVADRSVTDLQNGIITLMFTEESRQKLAEHTLEADTFLMVETMAYFEAYCHVLEGLKEMVDSEIPFQNYIVHCDTTMSAPVYLGKNHSNYSLERSIKKQSPTQKQISSSNPTWSTVTPIQQEITSSEEDTETTPKFDVLDFMTWPTKEELELDSSQFEAFQMALTSELSIVQGPPGTGKTYVGIKIVDALLNNSEIWKQGHNPILVVCYTNHALDQFLEGIYRYEKKNIEIVRVGSRSSSAILQRCTLSNIRSCRSFARGSQYMTLLSERDRIQEEMNDKSTCLQNAFKGVIHESFLEEHMHPFDFASFTMAKECKVTRYGLRRRSSIIAQWLGVSGEQSGDCSFAQRGECADLEDEAMEDSIKVIEEPEIAQSERMTGEYDINNQLRHVCERAAEKQHDIFVFMLTQQDKVDEKNDKDGVWQISKEMKRKLKNQIKRELEKKHYMDEVEYEQISNFWDLSISKRWEIYRLWRNQLITNIRVQISELENEYQEVINRLIELRNQEDHLILQKADVIGMTTTGAAKYRKILQKVRPKIVVVEEAAEVLEAHIITTLSSNCQHLILIGDHQQLRPTTTVYELAKNFNLDVSMFERLIRMDVPHVRLNYQHRMRPEIARLLTPHIYDNLENHESVYEYDNIKLLH